MRKTRQSVAMAACVRAPMSTRMNRSCLRRRVGPPLAKGAVKVTTPAAAVHGRVAGLRRGERGVGRPAIGRGSGEGKLGRFWTVIARGSEGSEESAAEEEGVEAEVVEEEEEEEEKEGEAEADEEEEGDSDDSKEMLLSSTASQLAAQAEEGSALHTQLSDLSAGIQALEEELKASEAACVEANANTASAKDQYLRLNADFDNFRKRTLREKEQIASKGRGDVLEELLPLIDNFEMAAKSINAETEGEEKIDASYQGIYKQMIELMRKAGLSVVDSVGTPFNPEVHDAIMREPTREFEEGVVMEEFRRGFLFGEQLLRPAMVKVAQAVEEEEEGGEAEPSDGGEAEEEAEEDAEEAVEETQSA